MTLKDFEFAALIEKVASIAAGRQDNVTEFKDYLHREILGIIRVHNDDVRVALVGVVSNEARKWHKIYGDAPMDKRYWEALFDAESLIASTPFPLDNDFESTATRSTNTPANEN